MKVACTVLEGESGGNPADLLGYIMLDSKKIRDMALPIASIPVLTGEVAQRFEERAQANYQRYLNRTEEQKKADEAILEKKFAELYSMLSKAHLGRR